MHQPLLADAPSPFLTARLITVAVAITIGTSLQCGFATGVLNNLDEVVPLSLARFETVNLTQWSFLVSGFAIGGFIGSVVGNLMLSQYFGRKTVLLIINIFVLASSILFIVGKTWYILLIGRILIGIVAGVSTNIVPLYFAEISPSRLLDAMSALYHFGISFGIVLAQAVTTPSIHLFGDMSAWRLAFTIPIICALIELVVLPFCPESPAYLYRTEGSVVALNKLAELHSSTSFRGHMALLRGERTEQQLEVSLSLMELLKLSGIDIIFNYSSLVLRQTTISDPQLFTVFLGSIYFLTSTLATTSMMEVQRRSVLFFSWAGLALSYFLLAGGQIGSETGWLDAKIAQAAAMVGTVGIVIAYSLGPGCVGWLLIGELLPMHAKEAAFSLGVATNWLANWAIVFAFPRLQRMMGSYTFLLFAFTSAGFGLFISRRVPETLGKTFTHIANEINKL